MRRRASPNNPDDIDYSSLREIFDPDTATWRPFDEVARDRTRKKPQPSEASVPSLEGDGAVTIPEAMQILALGKDTVYKAMKAGHLQWVKVGRTRRIPKAALRDFIARHLKGGWAIPVLRSAATAPASAKRRG